MFTEQELKTKDYLSEIFVPSVHQMMSKADPYMYLRYGGRCCKQISYLLKLFLTEALPQYEWTAWESMFIDEYEDYSHAWVYGRHSEDNHPHIIMDYGKLEHEYSFFLQVERNEYPEQLLDEGDSFPWFLDEEIEDERKPIEPSGNETFTQRPFEELYAELKKELNIEDFLNTLHFAENNRSF